MIDIDDQATKEKIYELTGQKQIKTCNHFLLFCADYHKITLLAEKRGLDMPEFPKTADGVIVGVVDATLAMMSALAAAEASGLGTCPIGYARTVAPDAIARMMKLPKGVFVVCGLAIGVPREMPDIKPKQPRELVVFRNQYSDDDDATLDALEKYDAAITDYNATRSGTKTDNDWVSHIVDYHREAMTYHTLDALRRRGFDVRQ